jgi:hypothetical protein
MTALVNRMQIDWIKLRCDTDENFTVVVSFAPPTGFHRSEFCRATRPFVVALDGKEIGCGTSDADDLWKKDVLVRMGLVFHLPLDDYSSKWEGKILSVHFDHGLDCNPRFNLCLPPLESLASGVFEVLPKDINVPQPIYLLRPYQGLSVEECEARRVELRKTGNVRKETVAFLASILAGHSANRDLLEAKVPGCFDRLTNADPSEFQRLAGQAFDVCLWMGH